MNKQIGISHGYLGLAINGEVIGGTDFGFQY